MAKRDKPKVSQKKVELIFRKLEPCLRCRISIHRVCQETKIPKSTFYGLLEENDEILKLMDQRISRGGGN